MEDIRLQFIAKAAQHKGMKAELLRRCASFASKPTVIAAMKNDSEHKPVKHQQVLKVAAGLI